MLCATCGPLRSGVEGGNKGGGGADADQAARLSALLCARCGQLLPSPDSTDLMLHRLEMLARFGLASEAAPVLVSSFEDQ